MTKIRPAVTRDSELVATLKMQVTELELQLISVLAAQTARNRPPPSRATWGKTHWSDHYPAAVQAAKREHGEAFWLVTNVAPWVRLNAAEASWRSPRGEKVRWLRDLRLPAPRFWPPGTFPKVDQVVIELPRTPRLLLTWDGPN